MDFELYKKINDERRNYKEMEDATVVSSYRNLGCGDGYRIYLKVENGLIRDCSYTTTGCGFGLASLAIMTEIVKGKTVEEAKKLTPEDIEKVLLFPERRKNYPRSAWEAMQHALQDYATGGGIPVLERVSKNKALTLLKQQGHLRGAHLSSIILEKENFSGVDFEGANLQNAFLQNANFEGANFKHANLRAAFLNDSNLKNADLRGADLRWTKLTGVKIEGARFDGALYDVGTRLDSHHLHLFKVMIEKGKEIFIQDAGGGT